MPEKDTVVSKGCFDKLKNFLTNKLPGKFSKVINFTEIYLAILILIAIFIASFLLFKGISDIFHNILDVRRFREFLGFAMILVIGVEFVKMLSRHTLGSAIEVLVFAIARKLIIEENMHSVEILVGVLAMAVLFAIRKYLLLSEEKL